MRIGEVARHSGVSARMLRHYDDLGLVVPSERTSAGYREYSVDDVRRLLHVECLRTLGLSLSEVRRALDEPTFDPASVWADLLAHTRARIDEQQRLLHRLEQVGAGAPENWEDVVDVVGLLHDLASDSGSRRQRAALARREGTDLPVETLVEALFSEADPNVAGALRWAVARAGEEALAALAGGLASTDAQVRRRALAAVTEIDADRATELLRGALADTDLSIRDRASVELGRRGEPAAVEHLVGMIVAGRNDVEAAETLGSLTGAAVPSRVIASALWTAFEGTVEPAQRLRLIQALAEIPGPEASGLLTRVAAEDEPVLAATAASILRLNAPETRSRRAFTRAKPDGDRR
ncbi:MerR family transcriptional regulator [Gordonia sp. X0973]|uniref:MerR family transcriptional regulator n=1 Tax=Gordonia sp. X0973 TaxID=2742602 RepID=UPI000F52652F|nr:MerR family transcriptional regulator [Gordonia sp. X0973]QKT07023.1 MerR family transcriptional regulator [Gordonia sp. X0973]